jgi:hypothetical protein
MNFLRVSSPVALVICSFVLIHGNLGAQNEQSSSAQSSTVKLEAGKADRAAASSGSNYTVHIRPTRSASTGRYSPLPTAAGSPSGVSGHRICSRMFLSRRPVLTQSYRMCPLCPAYPRRVFIQQT